MSSEENAILELLAQGIRKPCLWLPWSVAASWSLIIWCVQPHVHMQVTFIDDEVLKRVCLVEEKKYFRVCFSCSPTIVH